MLVMFFLLEMLSTKTSRNAIIIIIMISVFLLFIILTNDY